MVPYNRIEGINYFLTIYLLSNILIIMRLKCNFTDFSYCIVLNDVISYLKLFMVSFHRMPKVTPCSGCQQRAQVMPPRIRHRQGQPRKTEKIKGGKKLSVGGFDYVNVLIQQIYTDF